jgi:hypothetical protein
VQRVFGRKEGFHSLHADAAAIASFGTDARRWHRSFQFIRNPNPCREVVREDAVIDKSLRATRCGGVSMFRIPFFEIFEIGLGRWENI